ncbi:MAG: hypothetical protein ACKV2V_23210 [Blastocatellia bacterium]
MPLKIILPLAACLLLTWPLYRLTTASRASGQQPGQSGAAPVQPVAAAPKNGPLSLSDFNRAIERLSEPGGYFDTDNLISNESSYLHVMGKLRQLGLSGGAYIGVGPDQNFSYIAQVRPRIAIISDIRRDNVLQHLFFKALFARAQGRIEYLCLLTSRVAPGSPRDFDNKTIDQLTAWLDQKPLSADAQARTSAAIVETIRGYGVKISAEEIETVRRIHQSFSREGLSLQFTSHGRGPRSYYPTLRDLILEKDLAGRQCSYLASEESYQFLRTLQSQNLLIPITGDLGGAKALKEVGRFLKDRGEKVTAFYTSNVEYYLMQNDTFEQFAENVRELPRDPKGVFIRSFFGGTWGRALPQSVPGYYSTQLLQPLDAFVREYGAGRLRQYNELITRESLDLKAN